MPKIYNVIVSFTNTTRVPIEAKDSEQAKAMVQEMLDNGQYNFEESEPDHSSNIDDTTEIETPDKDDIKMAKQNVEHYKELSDEE